MIRALREQSSYSYGKSLEFVHIKGSFTEESRPLVEFLEQWVGRYEKAYLQTSGYSYLYRAALPKARTIVLDGWDWMDFWMRWETGYFMYSWMERRAVGMSRTQHWNADCS